MRPRVLSGLGILAGSLMLTEFDGALVHRIGWGVWCFGVLLFIDAVVLRRDGLPAQTLWGAGVAVGTALMFTDVPHAFDDGVARPVFSGVSFLLLLIAVVAGTPEPKSAGALFLELRDHLAAAARPERPADPPAEVARVQGLIASAIAEITVEFPQEGAELSALLRQYTAEHGNDTVETSARPLALRNAVTMLEDDIQLVHNRLMAKAGRSGAILVVAYTRLMKDLVLDNTR